jgi:large subunit ribosomal protein L32e
MGRKHPKFHRQNIAVNKRVGLAWRKPRGIDNKQRIHLKSAGALPKIGWRSPKSTRGMHPSGFQDKIVFNELQLAQLDPKTQAARIAAGVGGKKRAAIIKKAAELGLKVL